MLIMLIFLILSLVFILITIIYIDNKKKKLTKEVNLVEKQESTEETKNQKKQLKDILNIKIKNNIILKDTRYSSILELGNIDYNMLSEDEQNGIESILIQTALSIDYPIQFFTTTENIDTSNIINNIKNNKTSNKEIQEYQTLFCYYLQNLMENRNISVIKNYAIISYDGAYENAIDELNRRVLSFKNSLLRAKIQCEILEEKELYNLIYRELNKNSNSIIDSLLKGENSLYVKKKK